MNKEQLREGTAGAQQEVIEHEDYLRRAREASALSKSLQERLCTVRTFLRTTVETLHGYAKAPVEVTLERVPEEHDEEAEVVKPAGEVKVTIRPKSEDDFGEDFRRGHNYVIGYDLEFRFVPSRDPEKTKQIALESTLFQPPHSSNSRIHSGKPEVDIKDFTRHIHRVFNESEVQELKSHVKDHLKVWEAQIAALEQSVRLIEAALSDPDLNPWVINAYKKAIELKRANEERRQEEAARALATFAIEAEPTPAKHRGLWPRATRASR